MSDNFITVYLSHEPAAAPWDSKAKVSYQGTEVTVHANPNERYYLRTIQSAARQCQALPCKLFKLEGSLWQEDSQWAFYCGLDTSLHKKKLIEDNLPSSLLKRMSMAKWVKGLVNAAPAEMYPEKLAETCQTKFEALSSHVSTQIIKGEDLLKQGYHGLYTVGKGSDRPPVMAIFDYNPTDDHNAPVAAVLVGKGVTFDTGGYSIKPRTGMANMKTDMGGAATLAGAFAYAIERGLKQRVQLVLCCTENMVSGRAALPGDIITYKNGVTVEVCNTDAEGRLILADGLMIADEAKPKMIIDAATLTGANIVALGGDYAGLYTMDDELARTIEATSHQTHDPVWRMPLERWHQDRLPSDVADTMNASTTLGGGMGGSSLAAAFLSRFLKQPEKGWAHLDIAGPAHHERGNDCWAQGATALHFSLVAQLLLDQQ